NDAEGNGLRGVRFPRAQPASAERPGERFAFAGLLDSGEGTHRDLPCGRTRSLSRVPPPTALRQACAGVGSDGGIPSVAGGFGGDLAAESAGTRRGGFRPHNARYLSL